MSKKGGSRTTGAALKDRVAHASVEEREAATVIEEQQHDDVMHDPPAGCLLRVFWMVIGNVILLSSAYGILQHRSSFLSIADAFFWATVGSLLAARYVDIRHFHGTTSDGDPATMLHWRRYATFLGLISIGLWLGAHAIAFGEL